MKYLLKVGHNDIKKDILDCNNVDFQLLDVANFVVDYDQKLLREFKNKISEYRDKKFLIVGDYDCDGICATAIVLTMLRKLEIQANYIIPSRFLDGYGLNDEIVSMAYENGFEVLFMVDNGVKSTDSLKKAHDLGMKTLILDHHEYIDIPECDGFIHPELFPQEYSFMSAGGLACLLANSYQEDDYITVLGGLATLADMMRVFNYNRYLLKRMLGILKEKPYESIMTLLGKNPLNYENISYYVIPKINAVARMELNMNANHVVKYLLSSGKELKELAKKIELINKQRKEQTAKQAQIANDIANENQDILLVVSEQFSIGLCGLIANKLMREKQRPTIIFSRQSDILKGSGRSDDNFDLYNYLLPLRDKFLTYGGHNQAIGLSLKIDNLPALQQFINKNKPIYEEPIQPVLVYRQGTINAELLEQIEELSPYGTGFVKPLLGIENIRIQKRFNIKGMYPKFILNKTLSAISFNSAFCDVYRPKLFIGSLGWDSYSKGKLSFTIEEIA